VETGGFAMNKLPRIFLVEDDKAIAKNLTLLLRSEGFTVTHSATQKDALATLDKGKFELALIDISLPDGNGFTVCTAVKEAQNIPVIFLTASGDEISVVTGLNKNACLIIKSVVFSGFNLNGSMEGRRVWFYE
jgi:DNA-binding response OmpR family regulator